MVNFSFWIFSFTYQSSRISVECFINHSAVWNYSIKKYFFFLCYRVCILKNDSPFLLQICPKLCYFIHEYACLLPKRSAISEKLAINTNAFGRTALYTSQFWEISKKLERQWAPLHPWSTLLRWSGVPTGLHVFGSFLQNGWPFRQKTCIFMNEIAKFLANLK